MLWFRLYFSVLTERSLNRALAGKELRARWSRAAAAIPDHRDSLKFVQEVARFVTSRFFGKKSLGGSKKSLSWQHSASLILTSLSVWLQQHTHFQTYTHVQEYLDHGQSEGGPSFTISDWFRPRYEPNVCLLLNHMETFRVAETFFPLSNGWSHQCDVRFFFSRTIEKLGRTLVALC